MLIRENNDNSFSILYPATGDAFNLDTITNFQTIPFEWETSIDPDTVLYTNRLVCKVVCDGALISDGFESFTLNEQWDPVSEQMITRKMPEGYGTLSANWFTLQSNNDLTHQYVNSGIVDTTLENEERLLEISLIFSIELLILLLFDFTTDLIIALVSFKSEIVSEKSETLVLRLALVGSSKTKLIFSKTSLALRIIVSIFSCSGVSFSLTSSVKPGATDDFKVSNETATLLLSIAGIIAKAFPPIRPVS